MTINVKVRPQFPSQVLSGGGIDVSEANGNFSFALDYSQFARISPFTPGPNDYVLVWDAVAHDYFLVPPNMGTVAVGDPIPGGTPGSVLFIDGSGNLGQNNSNLFWDNTALQLKLIGGIVRTPLSADTAFYVSTTGNDSTGKGTAGNPWATLQHAYDTIAEFYDLANFTATISLGAGTFTSGLVISRPWDGGGAIAITGAGVGTTTISTTNEHCITNTASLPGSLFVSGMTLTCSSGSVNCIANFNAGGPIVINGNISFGAAALAHLYTQFYGVIIIASNYQIDGDAQYHYVVDRGGNINANNAYTVTINGARTFSQQFAHANGISSLGPFQGTTFSVGTSVTGTRFLAQDNSLIITSTGDPHFFPGSAEGSTTTESLYDDVMIGSTIAIDNNYTSASINQQGFINWQGNAWTFGAKTIGGAPTPGLQFVLGTADLLDYNISNGPRWSMFAPLWLGGGGTSQTISTYRQLVLSDFLGSGSGPAILFNGHATAGFWGIGAKDTSTLSVWFGQTTGQNAGWDTSISASHTAHFEIFNGSLGLGSGGTVDVYATRTASGVVSFGTTIGGADATAIAKIVQTGATTVASLPAAGTAGRRYFVTDANAATFQSIVAGGGANKVPVFDDGTNWRIG